MTIAMKFTKLSTVGISVIGSLFHSLGQIIIAIIFLDNFNMIYYLPFIVLFSIPSGVVIGLMSNELIKIKRKRLKFI